MTAQSNAPPGRKRPVVAIVDDDPADVHALRHAFKIIDHDIDFRALGSGEDLLALIDTADNGLGAPPDLVFLDINMPMMNGFETLISLRQRQWGKRTPVVMYSTSNDQLEVQRAYELGANSFVVKPNSLAGLKQLARRSAEFWFGSASLPVKPPVFR